MTPFLSGRTCVCAPLWPSEWAQVAMSAQASQSECMLASDVVSMPRPKQCSADAVDVPWNLHSDEEAVFIAPWAPHSDDAVDVPLRACAEQPELDATVAV